MIPCAGCYRRCPCSGVIVIVIVELDVVVASHANDEIGSRARPIGEIEYPVTIVAGVYGVCLEPGGYGYRDILQRV